MSLRSADNRSPGEPCEVVKECPICGGRMETVYDRHHQVVCVCVDCHTGLTVPATAWNVAKMKRSGESA